MTNLYKKFQDKSTALLNKYGIFYDHVRFDNNNNEIVVDDTKVGLLTSIDINNVPASLIENAQSLLISSVGQVKPEQEDYVRFNGTLYKIINYETVQPTNTTILYKLYVST